VNPTYENIITDLWLLDYSETVSIARNKQNIKNAFILRSQYWRLNPISLFCHSPGGDRA